MSRLEFSKNTKRLIADRAGQECSFPMCSRRTIGGDPAGAGVSTSGVAAHIYSASAQGPRGRGGLTDEEIIQPTREWHLVVLRSCETS